MNISDNRHNAGHAYMKRALQLSLYGGPNVSPNPFVGAVITARGRIIGEGYHRQFGGPHAEVNAINSIARADLPLLREAVMYATLEPCSHFGKTPPCADLIIEKGIPRVVVAAEDPFLKNHKSGIEKMQRAGIEVEVGMMKNEALWINRRFFTAHTLKRPYILLKWARSADGFIAAAEGISVKLSSTFTQMLMHRERAYYDAIMVGTNTLLNDKPRLNCRLWPARDSGRRPLKVSFESERIKGLNLFGHDRLITKPAGTPLKEFLHHLYQEHGITSLMVEGGSKTIECFADEGLLDEVRIERSPLILGEGIAAPEIKLGNLIALKPEIYGDNVISRFVKPPYYLL